MPATPDCTDCHGTGFVVRTVGRYDRAAPCRCRKDAAGADAMLRAGIPPRYRDCDLDSYDLYPGPARSSLKRGRAACEEFVESYPHGDGQGLLLIGRAGCGKTHLAVAVLRALAGKMEDFHGRFVDFRDLLRGLQETYSQLNPASAGQVLEPYLGAEVLVLDDLGSAKSTEWVRDTLGYIINKRYNDRKTTLFTTNYDDPSDTGGPATRESLAERIGVPLRSRLFEMCRTVKIEAPDFREIARKAHFGPARETP